MATEAEIQSQIVEIYIATFNRAPDAAGLTYWVTNVTTNGWSVSDVAQSFFDSPEVAENYPTTLSNGDFIDKIYNNVLNRDSDAEGKAYWVEQMNNNITKNEMIITIINGAKADTGSAEDKLILENKKEVGEYFAITLALEDIATAKSTMAIVTTSQDTVTQAKHMQDAFSKTSPFMEGTTSNDQITGTTATNYIYSFEGDDNITTGDGENVVVSGSGIDTIHAGSGNDTIYADDGNDTVYAKAGDDTIYGGAGEDSLHGEDGTDTIYGEDDDDYLYGEGGADLIYGGSGNDFIYGGAGSNTLYGNDGDDSIYAQDGTNLIDAGAGADVIYSGTGDDTIYGGAGDDIIYGNDGADIIDGLTDNDTVYAGKGDDIISGNDGIDILYGSEGNDTINGEKGDDYIIGGLGADILTGGLGVDTFVIEALDTNLTTLDYITDFTFHTDKIKFVNQGSEVIGTTKVDVTAATTLQEASDIASAGDGSTHAIINWFRYEDDTYIVEDLTAAITFTDASDLIVKLQGIIDLSGLDTSTVSFA